MFQTLALTILIGTPTACLLTMAANAAFDLGFGDSRFSRWAVFLLFSFAYTNVGLWITGGF